VLNSRAPSNPAALVCQAGYASRTGALWVTRQLPVAVSDLEGLREWMSKNRGALGEDDFWESADHRLLWRQVSAPSQGEYPRRWNRLTATVAPRWRADAPPAGSFVRLVPQSGRSVLVCNDALET